MVLIWESAVLGYFVEGWRMAAAVGSGFANGTIGGGCDAFFLVLILLWPPCEGVSQSGGGSLVTFCTRAYKVSLCLSK